MLQLPPAILAAAFAPALTLLALMIGLGGRRYAKLPACLACFAAGALLSAPIAAWLNQLITDDSGLSASAMREVGAPIVEEALKALVVWLSLVLAAVGSTAKVEALIVRGICVGLGFTAMENTQYLLLAALQGGSAGLWQGIFVRGFAWGWHHAVFTAAAAVAIWYAKQPSPDLRRIGLWVAFAILQHMGWNSIGAPQITTMVCSAPAAGAACRWPPGSTDLFLLTPLLSMAALLPGIAAVAMIVRRRHSGVDQAAREARFTS